MENSGKNKYFDQSMQFDAIASDDELLEARRLATYSVNALRVAKSVDRTIVLFPAAVQALTSLDRLFQLGTEFNMPQGMRLVGPSGVGKTASFEYFRASLPNSALFAQGMAAISVRVQNKPRTSHLVQAILNAIRYPFNSGSARQLYMRRSLLFDALKNYKTRLIWLDEAQHLLYQRRSEMSNEWENDATEFLRELVDECKLSLVLAGTSELDNLPEVAPHLSSRVSGRESMDNFIADANWVGFVRGFVKQCQSFDLTCMNDVQMAMRLHMASEGNLRAFKRLVTEAVLIAYDSNDRQVDRKALQRGFQGVFGAGAVRGNPFV